MYSYNIIIIHFVFFIEFVFVGFCSACCLFCTDWTICVWHLISCLFMDLVLFTGCMLKLFVFLRYFHSSSFYFLMVPKTVKNNKKYSSSTWTRYVINIWPDKWMKCLQFYGASLSLSKIRLSQKIINFDYFRSFNGCVTWGLLIDIEGRLIIIVHRLFNWFYIDLKRIQNNFCTNSVDQM